MKTKDEALKMAIEVLQGYAQADSPAWRKALNACKQALEQPESNIDYDLYRNVDRPVNPEGYKK